MVLPACLSGLPFIQRGAAGAGAFSLAQLELGDLLRVGSAAELRRGVLPLAEPLDFLALKDFLLASMMAESWLVISPLKARSTVTAIPQGEIVKACLCGSW